MSGYRRFVAYVYEYLKGKKENNCGFICIGGQNDTIMVSINGLGCTIGKYGWEEDLHAWLRLFATRPKITRLDLAFDDFDSDFASVDWAKEQQELGGFKMGGRPPKFNIIGDYWSPDGSGSTAYIFLNGVCRLEQGYSFHPRMVLFLNGVCRLEL